MPLGTRDIMMVIRARDLASRTLRNVGTNIAAIESGGAMTADKLFRLGSALTTFGLGVGAIGAAGVLWLNQATEAAMGYNQEAAKTLTQVDQTGVKLEDIKDIARDVAREIPAPFNEMQTALYDIFSSMDVNVGGARILLREFSRAAVAGQVELQSAARGTIGVLNAYGLGAADVNKINDIMFQLVRKGVGTYDEFSKVIGYATPAAVRAGQSFQDLAGMMAFLTRNGLSASSASISAARALENLSNPTIVGRLEDMGVQVKNAAGEFLPMVDIVGQLTDKFEGLTKPEISKKLQDLLKGSGNNAQARRFWNTALQNFEQFKSLTGDMANSAGTLDAAYATMFEAPQTQIQMLRNQYDVLKTEIGDELIPVKLELARIALRLLDAWNGLSDGTKSLIIKIAAFISVFMLVAGIAMTVVGSIAMVIAVLAPLVGGIGMAIAVVGGFMAALILIPIIIYLIIRNFDTLKRWALTTWEVIKAGASTVWQALQSFWDWLSDVGVGVWHTIYDAAKTTWDALIGAWRAVVGAFKAGWAWLDRNFGGALRRLFRAIGEEAPKVFKEIAETFESAVGRMGAVIRNILNWLSNLGNYFMSFYNTFLRPALEIWWKGFTTAFQIIVEVVTYAITVIRSIIEIGLGFIVALWENFSGLILPIVKYLWNSILNVITTAIKIISNIIQFFLNIFQGDWKAAWQNVKNILNAAWEGIKRGISLGIGFVLTLIRNLPGAIVGFLKDMISLLYNKGRDIIQGLLNGIKNVALLMWEYLGTIMSKVKNFFKDAASWLFNIGKSIIQGLWNGMKDVWNSVTNWLGGLGGAIGNLKGPPAKDAVLLTKNGRLIMKGLQRGLMQGWQDVESTLGGMNASINGTVGVSTSVTGARNASSAGMNGSARYGMYVAGDLVVREERAADDLDWWSRSRGAGV